jgi:hypothetical protein
MPRHNEHWPAGDKRGGQFMPKAGGPAEPTTPKQRRPKAPARPKPETRTSDVRAAGATWEAIRPKLAAATVDQLTDAFRSLSALPAGAGRDRALVELDAELARREGSVDIQDDPHSRQIDDLVAGGWEFHQAYAEVHHLDPARLDQEARLQLVEAERRPGERRRDTLRRMYAEHVYLSWLQAERDTRGSLLNEAGKAKGIDPTTLWSGPTARARKYASDELKGWWESHGGRTPFVVWSAPFSGDRAGAQAAKLAGSGKDFGV